MMDIDKAFEEFIEFPEGSSGNLVTTVSAKLFAKYCTEKLQEENERLRLQLAACGVVALANTPESAARQRDMHPDYMSASCQDVIAAVDREIALREERDQLKAQINGMKQAIDELIEHSFGVAGLYLNGEVAEWSDLRGEGRFCEWLAVFDDTPEQCLAEHDAGVIERACSAVMPGPCYPPDDPPVGYQEYCEGVAAVRDYANQLRQQAKEVQS